MNSSVPMIDSEQFEYIATKCHRWSERSLNVARALIIDKTPLSKVVKKYKISAQHAVVIRTRFTAKAKKVQIEEFMNREKPQLDSSAVIKPFSNEMQTLRDKGYSDEQIVAYLEEIGVSTSPKTIRDYFRSIKA